MAHSLGWVSGRGPAPLISGNDVEGLQERITSRYLTTQRQEHFKTAPGLPDDCVIEITPERWLSLDMNEGFRRMPETGHADEEILGGFLPFEN